MLYVIPYNKAFGGEPKGLYGPFDWQSQAERFIKEHLSGWDVKIIRPMAPEERTA